MNVLMGKNAQKDETKEFIVKKIEIKGNNCSADYLLLKYFIINRQLTLKGEKVQQFAWGP